MHGGLTTRASVILARDVADQDGDGIPDAIDVCPRTPDPEQSDDDRDGIGDACRPGCIPGALELCDDFEEPSLARH
jgi:hypothetical protein